MKWLRNWQQDRILSRVMRNSSILFASYAMGAVLTILTANLLGVAQFGVLGTVTVFVSNINRLFSFRMGEVMVRYMGEALAHEDRPRAAAMVKAAFLIEALTSLVAFLALAAVAPLGAQYFAKDTQSTPLFLIYGISILMGACVESATGVLQVTNHYRSQALITFVQTVLVAILLGLAAVYQAGLPVVLAIYLVGKVILGLGPLLVALYWLPRVLGKDWLRAPFSLLPPRRELARFAISTNFSGTVNLLARDSELPIVSFFFGTAAAGYYKIALALINLVIMPINPYISTTYPEITRAFAARQWARLRSLLQRVTLISGAWTALVTAGLLLFGRQLLFEPLTWLGRSRALLEGYLPAYPVLLVLLAGYGVANIFFWNRPLLLAQGLAHFPLKVSLVALLVKLALTPILLPRGGYLAEAGLLSGYLLITVSVFAWRGLSQARKAERQDLALEGGGVTERGVIGGGG
jgi:O-antigen/teichoic acid export membrane protein